MAVSPFSASSIHFYTEWNANWYLAYWLSIFPSRLPHLSHPFITIIFILLLIVVGLIMLVACGNFVRWMFCSSLGLPNGIRDLLWLTLMAQPPRPLWMEVLFEVNWLMWEPPAPTPQHVVPSATYASCLLDLSPIRKTGFLFNFRHGPNSSREKMQKPDQMIYCLSFAT